MKITRLLSILLAALATTAHAAIPQTMRAAAFDAAGAPAVLSLHTLAVPEIAADEVLIAVHVAGVAIWDADIRKKLSYAANPRFPFVLGSDGSGTVAAVGSAVTRFKVGDLFFQIGDLLVVLGSRRSGRLRLAEVSR